jgi:hypothetical protein
VFNEPATAPGSGVSGAGAITGRLGFAGGFGPSGSFSGVACTLGKRPKQTSAERIAMIFRLFII